MFNPLFVISFIHRDVIHCDVIQASTSWRSMKQEFLDPEFISQAKNLMYKGSQKGLWKTEIVEVEFDIPKSASLKETQLFLDHIRRSAETVHVYPTQGNSSQELHLNGPLLSLPPALHNWRSSMVVRVHPPRRETRNL